MIFNIFNSSSRYFVRRISLKWIPFDLIFFCIFLLFSFYLWCNQQWMHTSKLNLWTKEIRAIAIDRWENRKSIRTNDCAMACRFCSKFHVFLPPSAQLSFQRDYKSCKLFYVSLSLSISCRLCRHFQSCYSLFSSHKNINLFAMFYDSCNIKCFHFGLGVPYRIKS